MLIVTILTLLGAWDYLQDYDQKKWKFWKKCRRQFLEAQWITRN